MNQIKEKIRICLNCNKKFKSSKPRKYCSVECFHKHIRAKRGKCLVCGKILPKSAKKYCSSDCMVEYQYQTYIQA